MSYHRVMSQSSDRSSIRYRDTTDSDTETEREIERADERKEIEGERDQYMAAMMMYLSSLSLSALSPSLSLYSLIDDASDSDCHCCRILINIGLDHFPEPFGVIDGNNTTGNRGQ